MVDKSFRMMGWAERRAWVATVEYVPATGELLVALVQRRPHSLMRSRLRRLHARFWRKGFDAVHEFEGRTEELFERGELLGFAEHDAHVRLVGVVFRPRF